jgi:hypothetical protein
VKLLRLVPLLVLVACGGKAPLAGTKDAGRWTGGPPEPVDAGPDAFFDIATLPGVVLWLDAARGIALEIPNTDRVVTWEDGSPKHNDLMALQPNVVPSFVPSALNGLPAVQLGPAQRLATRPAVGIENLALGTHELLVLVVAKWTSGASDAHFFEVAMTTPSFAFLGQREGAVAVALETAGRPATVTPTERASFGDGAFRLYGARRFGAGARTTLELRVNGAVEALAMGPALGADLPLPTTAAVGPGQDLAVAELVVVKAHVADDELARVEAHLMAKYGLR